MNYYVIPPIVTAIILASIGFFVYSKDKKTKINLIFGLFCLSMVWWLSCYAAMYLSTSSTTALFWARCGFLGIIFIPILAYHFICSFLGINNKGFLILIYALGGCSIVFSRTNYIYKGIKEHFWGYYPVAGSFYVLFLIMFGILFTIGITLLFLSLWKGDLVASKRRQISYVLLAFGFGIFGIVDYFAKYALIDVYPFGYVCALFFISLIAYSIAKHHLMGIDVVMKKTLVFAGLFTVSYAVFAGFAYLSSFLFESVVQNRWIAMVPSVFVIVIIFRPLEAFLRNITDKFLFQKRYDYRQLLKTFANEVLTVLDLNELLDLTATKLVEIMKLTGVSVILYSKEEDKLKMGVSVGEGFPEIALNSNEEFIKSTRERGQYILLEKTGRKKLLSAELEKKTLKPDSSPVIPLMHHENMVGMLSLGKTKSDEGFTPDDLDILLTLAKTLSIAITNARLFEELSVAQAQAAQREKMAVIGTLSAGVNHEICNPLGVVRGQCEMFLLNLVDGIYKDKSPEELIEKAQEIMKKVIHETDRATVITRKLSAFAKPAKGEMADNVRVEEELEKVISLIEHELKLDDITITKDIEKDLPSISADEKQIQEVFFNIMRNAAQSIRGSGEIRIQVSSINGIVYIAIRDTGEGIREQHLERIFDPFFTTRDPGEGTGLGLFIVKQIVERNNGRINVRSEIGKGTAFQIEFNAAVSENKTDGQRQ